MQVDFDWWINRGYNARMRRQCIGPVEVKPRIWFAWYPVRLYESTIVVWLCPVYRCAWHQFGLEYKYYYALDSNELGGRRLT